MNVTDKHNAHKKILRKIFLFGKTQIIKQNTTYSQVNGILQA